MASQEWLQRFSNTLNVRWWRIRWYRRFYELGIKTHIGTYLGCTYINTANALWDAMSELDRRFILATEKM